MRGFCSFTRIDCGNAGRAVERSSMIVEWCSLTGIYCGSAGRPLEQLEQQLPKDHRWLLNVECWSMIIDSEDRCVWILRWLVNVFTVRRPMHIVFGIKCCTWRKKIYTYTKSLAQLHLWMTREEREDDNSNRTFETAKKCTVEVY